MVNTSALRSMLDRLLLELPESLRAELRIKYGYCNPLHGLIDVVIMRGDQCMALGRFRPVSENAPSEFSERFRMAMGYPADTWYLFDFDGERIVLNDLSMDDPEDEFSEATVSTLRQLCTRPAEWKEEEKTQDEMKRFLEAMRFLISEEAILNPVK
jgi:hypothetical protein